MTLTEQIKNIGIPDSMDIPKCINEKPRKVIQVWCDLNDRPCVMYDGDSLNGKICSNYLD